MSNHVYYGEYSLAYWIELILTRKIVLPKYQRHFVWNKDSLKTLINTFQDNRFVPPVTIGAFCKSDGSITNYIIDGQQRLTSILLAYLDLFPDKEKYKTHLLALARGEESIDEDEGDPYDNVLEWNLSYLTEKGNDKNEICSKLEEDNYMSIGLELPNQFFHEHYLGFSYIVPAASDETSQQCYYTKMFRDINVQGVQLIDIESRRSLYFLNERYEDFFEPAFVANYYVNRVGEKQQLDFTRYLCLLSAFKKSNNENRVARGFSGKRIEKYIEMYIYSVVGNDNEDIFGRFSEIFPGSDFAEDIQCLKSTLENLNLPKEYPSIINMDMYFFGLIYHVLLCHRHIDISRKWQLKNRIERRINDLRDMDNHAQAPAQFQYMRQRLIQSINVYETFVLS